MEDFRQLKRVGGTERAYPISCVLTIDEQQFNAQVLNYHFGGAAIRVDGINFQENRIERGNEIIASFFLGRECVSSNVICRVAWEKFQDDLCLGLQFLRQPKEFVERAIRVATHATIRPSLLTADPIHPDREIHFDVDDVSLTGLRVSTSLTNKHLLPGMKLTNGKVRAPGSEEIAVTLIIEYAEMSNVPGRFTLGLSVADGAAEYKEVAKKYIATFTMPEESTRVETLAKHGLLSRKIKNQLSYRVVDNEKDYQKILKLRFAGYSAAGKVKPGTDASSQGEGLANEGMIIGAYLGNEPVATMELRFGNGPIPLRLMKHLEPLASTLDLKSLVEINKLTVHPKIQGSDVLIGMFQMAHACLLANGGANVIAAVTDQLLPLYKKAGFEPLNLSFSHPVLADTALHLVLLKNETYNHELKVLNPASWTLIYKLYTDHYSNIGLIPKPQTTELTQREVTTTTKEHVDPKWTSQDIVATIMLPYLMVSRVMIGQEKTNAILERFNLSWQYFNSESNWASIEFLDAFLEEFSKYGDIEELSRRAGELSFKKEILGIKYYILKHIPSVELIMKAFEKNANRFNRTREYVVESLSPGRATVCLGVREGKRLPKHRASCKNWHASFSSFLNLMTGKKCEVTETACCYEGAKSCRFELRWATQTSGPIKKIFPFALAALPAGIHSLNIDPIVQVGLDLLALSPLTTLALMKLIATIKDRANLRVTLDNFERDANERYQELQKSKERLDHRYREAQLLEVTSREIQTSRNLSSKLAVALNTVCKDFGFVRSFIMLKDDKLPILKTAAVSGLGDANDDIWKFTVDVSELRESSVVISSMYLTGNSAIIADVQKSMFQFNENSQKILQKLHVSSFVIVPIPGRDRNWGVLVSDKGTNGNKPNREDLVLLQRLAQNLGVALDVHSQIAHENQLRTIFERYVPPEVLSNALNNDSPTLGGSMRNVVCLFADIRNFTEISYTLPPPVLVSWLNLFLQYSNEVVNSYHGFVDRYIGDAFLATWGAIKETNTSPTEAVRCALAIIENLGKLNEQFDAVGYPRIRIGVGIHIGEAVVGNIGSDKRMDFTIIGRDVNIASRLQTLTKEYNTPIVISEKIFSALPDDLRNKFLIQKPAAIRGVKDPFPIATFQTNSNPKSVIELKKGA